MNANRYITQSLELHLFFGRIMKEHALFLQAGFTQADPSFVEKAEFYQEAFASLLSDVVKLSDGAVGRSILDSGELVTEFTALAETQTQRLTGIAIDKELTSRTLRLNAMDRHHGDRLPEMRKLRRINRTALQLLDGLIDFKETILGCVEQGQMFTLNYPLLIEHILREAKLYRKYLQILEREGELPERLMKGDECFWNQIMMEHAWFIRGLLDPCEKALMAKADDFADGYCKLLEACRNAQDKTIREAILIQTEKFRDFKAAGTQGIQQCKIRSVILPLLADHVLREANHFIRLLQM